MEDLTYEESMETLGDDVNGPAIPMISETSRLIRVELPVYPGQETAAVIEVTLTNGHQIQIDAKVTGEVHNEMEYAHIMSLLKRMV